MPQFIRKPAAAGRFYPRESSALSALVEDLLQDCPDLSEESIRQTTAIVVPHAGYPYSGPTAAAAFGYVRRKKPDSIWLIGPSHHYAFEGVALSEAGSFLTPLGNTPVHEIVYDLSRHTGFHFMESAHSQEHSLEVELPFIQVLWGDEVPIIPLLVGHNNGWKDLQELASVLREFRSPDDLWVISNDFTHYGKSFGYTPFPARDAEAEIRKIDLHGAELITTGKAEEFFHLARKTTFDGGTSIPLAMLSLAPCEGKLLMHMLSGEQTGSFDHSVSYLAIALNCRTE